MATIRVKRTTGITPPSGLTFGELAFVGGITSFYATNNLGESIRVGAQVDTDTTLAADSDNRIPTQKATKAYVDAAVSASGVNQFATVAVANQPSVVADQAGDTVTFVAGTGITLTTDAGADSVTIGNLGVLSITGTTNQITRDVSTGAVTLSLPSNLVAPGSLTVTTDLTVTGNMTVNGTTTTVNSDVTTVDDPIMLLGTSGGVPITVTDGGKDRGIAFTYFDGSAGRTGFFGFDASASKFTFVPVATISGDIVTSGSVGDVQFKSIFLTTDGTNVGGLTLAPLTNNRTYTLPNVSGTIITTGDSGTVTSTMIANDTIVNDDINASAGIVDTKLATISTADKVSISAIDINGATDIGAALVDADLIIVDDGAGGTNRKSEVSRIATYVFGKVSADITIASNGVAAIGSGVIVNDDINASAGIVDTKLATISTANKVSLSALDIDGGTETTTIEGSDLLIVDDGAGGANRKVTVNNLFSATSTGIVDGGTY
jgi:hypothetical protein